MNEKICIGIILLGLLFVSGCNDSSFDNCIDFCLTKENPNKSFVTRDGGVYECTPFCLTKYSDINIINKCYDECRGI